MNERADTFEREPLNRAFLGAVGLHVTIVGGMALYGWVANHGESLGSPDAGGAVAIESVSTIPIPHRGAPNPLANDSKSETPQAPTKPLEREKAEKIDPEAISLKSREKKRQSDVASEKQRFRPFNEVQKNQLYSKQAPAVSNPMFSAAAGAGRVGTGAHTTLGTRFPAYAQQIQQLVAQKWRTGDVNAQTAPSVIATFDLMRDGTVRNVRLLQGSGNRTLDYSVERAIIEASPLPPMPREFENESMKVEFTFELKR